MKRIELGSRVNTDQGEGHLVDRKVLVEGNISSEGWIKPGRSKEAPIFTVQLFDGTFTSVTGLSSIGDHSIDDHIPYGLRSFLMGNT